MEEEGFDSKIVFGGVLARGGGICLREIDRSVVYVLGTSLFFGKLLTLSR